MNSDNCASTNLETILEQANKLPDVLRRAVGSILGAVVADAATRPLHWIYREAELEIILEDGKEEGILEPEFWPESKSPFYTLPTGSRSCYSHVMQAGLLACWKSGGKLNIEVYKEVLREKFGEGTEWQECFKRRKQAYDADRRREWREPVIGPWLHGSVIHFLQHGEGEPGNLETDGFLLSVPHLVYNAEQVGVVEESQEIARLLTTKPTTLEYMRIQAEILVSTVRTGTFHGDKLGENYGDNDGIQQLLNNKNLDHKAATAMFGNNCYLPGSLLGSLHAVITANNYTTAVRKTIKSGGCNCSRSNYIGAILGGCQGLDTIPRDWMSRTTDFIEIASKAVDIAHIIMNK